MRTAAGRAAPATAAPGSPEPGWAELEALAAGQRGVAARHQIRALGFSPRSIDRLVERRQLIVLHRGVYAVGHRVLPALALETAALLAYPGRTAVLSHETAARLWGIRPPGGASPAPAPGGPSPAPAPGGPSPAPPIHVSVPHACPGARGSLVTHRTRTLRRRDVRRLHGLPVTSPARTLLDLAQTLAPRELERAFEEALVRRLLRLPQLHEVLRRAHGRRGARQLAALAEPGGARGRTRSEAEERFLRLVREASLSEPERNARILGYEIDFLWRAEGVGVEVDGFAFHGTRAAFERDREKSARLAAGGLTVLRHTWRQQEREPTATVVRVAQALARRSRELRV